MVPLYIQLESRYRDLEEIRESLWNLDGEVLTYEMAENLSINFHHLDIDTGATSDLVTPYFLPRSSFPSCRDMSGDLKDWMLDAGQDRASYGERWNPPILPRFFPAALQLTHDSYACGMSRDLDDLICQSKITHHGWVKDRAFSREHVPGRPHHFTRAIRYTTDIEEKKGVPFLSHHVPSSQSPSHCLTDVIIFDCHKGLPSISEVVAVVEEILDAMRAQRNELRSMTDKQSLTTFHHILPRMVRLYDLYGHCRLLYAYFDGRLRVQFTEVLDFTPFAVEPPPEKNYLDIIDLPKYYDTIDKMLKWAWPVVQGDTSKRRLEDCQNLLDDPINA